MAVKKVNTLNAHENPSTNENEFDVENYMNVNWEKIIDVVDNNADELIEAQQTQIIQNSTISDMNIDIEENANNIIALQKENTALKEELERQKEDNKLNGLTEDNSGELVHIENTTGARFNSLEIFGNEKQETREGKNLYNVYDTEGRNFNSTLLKIDDEDKISLKDYTNSSDKTKWVNFETNINQKIKANTDYYVVTEIFSVNGEGQLTTVSSNASSPGQFATSVSYNFSALAAGDVKIAQITSREDLSTCVSMLRSFLQFTAGQGGSISFRVSVLEKSVTAEDFKYERYGESPSFNYLSEIKTVENSINLKICNKNFLDIQKNATVEKGGMTFTTDEDGILTINGTSNTNIYLQLNAEGILDNNVTNWKQSNFKEGNYVFSVENLSDAQSGYVNINAFVRKGAYVSGHVYAMLTNVTNAKTKSVAMNLTEDVNAVCYLWIANGITLNNAKLKFQIELDNATEIVANEEQSFAVAVQQPMFSKDKFDLLNKKEKHYMKKLILDGTQNVWGAKESSSGKVVQFGITLPFTAKEDAFAISNYFKKEKNYGIVNTFVISSLRYTVFFHIPREDITEITDVAVKNLLKQKFDAGNPVTLWVEAEEPDELDLTDEQIEVLEQIEQATTYKEVTNVYTEDEIGAIIKTNTNVDLSKMINNVVEAQLSQIGG